MGGVIDRDEPARDAALAAFAADAIAAWPSLDLAVEELVAHLRGLLANDPGVALPALRGADLCLAWACGRSDPRALAILEADHLADVARRARAGRIPTHDPDELVQLVRERLLVGTPETPPRILSYAGRGDLRGWIVIVATRVALNARRSAHPHGDAHLADDLAASSDDPALAHLRARYRDVFRRAVATAIETLDPHHRLILKQHYIDRVGVGELAELHGVHRATTSRWLTDARHAIGIRTREVLAREHGVDPEALASIVRLFDSDLGVTLRGLR